MIRKRNRKKPPERNWVSLSIILIILTVLVTILYYDTLSRGDLSSFFSFVYILTIWILDCLYVVSNTIRENPDFELKKSLSKIKSVEIYESWYFLTALGLIFGVVVWGIFLNIDKILGTAVCTVLYGFLLAWVRDILKNRRDNLSKTSLRFDSNQKNGT